MEETIRRDGYPGTRVLDPATSWSPPNYTPLRVPPAPPVPPTPVSVGLLHQTTSCAAWLSAADRDWDEKGSREPEIGGGKPVSHNKLRCNFARVCSFSLGPSAATEVFASEHSETWKPMSMQGAGGKRAPPVNTRENWNEKRGSARSSARRARASHVHYCTLRRT